LTLTRGTVCSDMCAEATAETCVVLAQPEKVATSGFQQAVTQKAQHVAESRSATVSADTEFLPPLESRRPPESDSGGTHASLEVESTPANDANRTGEPATQHSRQAKPSILAFLPLYTAYALICGVQRAFTFVVPIFLMIVSQRALNRTDGSFVPAAIYMLSSRGACFLLGPTVGKLLDWGWRFRTAAVASVLYGVSTSLCAIWMPLLARYRPNDQATAIPEGTLWFCVFGTIAALSEFALEISLWKRWLPLTVHAQQYQSGAIDGSKTEEQLAIANARMRRITMTIDIGMPLLVGWLLSSRGEVQGSVLVARFGAFLLAIQLVALFRASQICARGENVNASNEQQDAARRTGRKVQGTASTREEPIPSTTTRVAVAARTVYQHLRELFSSWRLYYEQETFVPSLAHVSLYFTVLSPGGLLFGFLTYCGVNGSTIGIFRAASAIIGILATFSFEILVTRLHWSVLQVGRVGVLCQLACLLPAQLLLWLVRVPEVPLPSAAQNSVAQITYQQPPLLIGVLVFVTLSRWGLWCWDTAETEIMQTMVDASAVGEVSAVEAALCSLAELLMYGVSFTLSSPRRFPTLATMSTMSISTGALAFHRWTKRQDRRRQHLDAETEREDRTPFESGV
jgi:hypothetical protein